MPKKLQGDLAQRIQKHLTALRLGKKWYKLADQRLDKLLLEMEPGQSVKLANGKTFQLQDKFAVKNRINVGLNARRYDFVEIEVDK